MSNNKCGTVKQVGSLSKQHLYLPDNCRLPGSRYFTVSFTWTSAELKSGVQYAGANTLQLNTLLIQKTSTNHKNHGNHDQRTVWIYINSGKIINKEVEVLESGYHECDDFKRVLKDFNRRRNLRSNTKMVIRELNGLCTDRNAHLDKFKQLNAIIWIIKTC